MNFSDLLYLDRAGIFVLIGFVFVSIVAGVYFLVRKPKICPDISPTGWIDKANISDAAKAVHLKEFNKQTAPRFSKAWFFEYFLGQRSAFYAWWTWVFIGGFIIHKILLILVIS